MKKFIVLAVIVLAQPLINIDNIGKKIEYPGALDTRFGDTIKYFYA